jgi:hypothetical protein
VRAATLSTGDSFDERDYPGHARCDRLLRSEPLALFGGELRAKERSYSAAVAAGILLALAFVELFPEGLELAGQSSPGVNTATMV